MSEAQRPTPAPDGPRAREGRTPALIEAAAGDARAAGDGHPGEIRFRALALASADVIYRMSADWSSMHMLDGRGFLTDTAEPSAGWLARYIHPDDQPRVAAAIGHSIRTTSTFELEHRVIRADGTLGWTFSRAVPVLDDAGEIVEWVGAATDVTARHQAAAERERLLQEAEAARAASVESEAKFRFALDVADLGAWDLDLATRRAWRSPRHDQIFGYDAMLPEWTYAEFLAHVVPEDRPRVDEAFGGALAAAAPWDFTCRIRRADGAERWVAARGEPIRDAMGSPVRLVGVVRDVTAEREAEAALRAAVASAEAARGEADAARRAAEAASGAKSEFLAVMSHELRTPLNAIGGYAELIELGIHGPVTAEQRTALDRIQRSQRALLSVINEVLNYARLETGAVTYSLADVRVTEAVGEAEVLVAPQLRAKGLGYAWVGCDPRLAVRADPDKLQQILLNLLSNAIKFTPGTSEARDGEPGRITTSCASDGARVHLVVSDTGIGISSDQLEAIFEPFVQVDARLTRPNQGTGLGLAISRDLARAMGGDLTVESTLGAGSTFTLALPAA